MDDVSSAFAELLDGGWPGKMSCHIGFFGMNTTQPGWNDVHVRRAVAYALNRTDII